MQIRVDDNITPNGKPASHVVITKRPYAVVFAQHNDKVVMVKQIRYATQLPSLELPMGYLEENEDPLEGAKRELVEETGYTATSWKSLGMHYLAPAFVTQQCYAFYATDLTFTQTHHDETEFLEIVEVPIHKLIDMIQSEEIDDGATITTILKAKTYILEKA